MAGTPQTISESDNGRDESYLCSDAGVADLQLLVK